MREPQDKPESKTTTPKKGRVRKQATIEGTARDITNEKKTEAEKVASPAPKPSTAASAPKPDAAKPQTEKPDAPKAETPKTEPLKSEAPKAAAPKSAIPKPETKSEPKPAPKPTEEKKPEAAKPFTDVKKAETPSKEPRTPIFLPVLGGAVGGAAVAALVLYYAADMGAAPAPTGESAAAVSELRAELSALQDRLTNIETATPSQPPEGAAPDLTEDVARLEESIVALSQRLENLSDPASGEMMDSAALEGLNEAVGLLANRLGALEEGASMPASEALSALEAEIASLSSELTAMRETQRAEITAAQERDIALARLAGLLPVLDALARDVAEGRDYQTHGRSLQALGLTGEEVGALTSSGLPSDASLERQLSLLHSALQAQTRPQEPQQEEGIVGTVGNFFSSLVTVRRTDERQLSPVDPVREAVRSGQFSEARARLTALPLQTHPAYVALDEALSARIAFERALSETRTRLQSALDEGN